MNPSLQKNRMVCGALALSLWSTTSVGLAQPGAPSNQAQPAASALETPQADAGAPVQALTDQPTKVEGTEASTATAAAAATATATATASAAAPAADAAVGPVPAAVSAPVLRVVYSHLAADKSMSSEVMDKLRVVRQQATTNQLGQQVAINAALILLTGGLALNFRGFSKDDLTGMAPDDVTDWGRLENPAMRQLPDALQKQVAQWLSGSDNTRERKFTRPLVVNAAAWRLIYNSLDAADLGYKLKFDVEIYKDRENPSFLTGDKRPGKPCSYVSEARPLSDWKAGDYQAVVDAVPLAVSHCAHEFVAQLPRLLELE